MGQRGRASVGAMQPAIEHIGKMGFPAAEICIETAFLPFDAGEVLRASFVDSSFVDAIVLLEWLRARKTLQELVFLKRCLAGLVFCDSAKPSRWAIHVFLRYEAARQ